MKRTNGPIILCFGIVDDEDIVEYFIEYHRSVGIDAFVCVDVGSTDGTLDILRSYESTGYLHLTRRQNPETGGGLYTNDWSLSDFVVTARERYNAEWCLFADSDEFWVFPSNDAVGYFAMAQDAILSFPRYNMLPTRDAQTDALLHFSKFTWLVRRPIEFTYDINRQDEVESLGALLAGYPPEILRAILPKVAGRSDIIRSVAPGFHDLTPIDASTPRHSERSGYVAHFPVRTLTQFRRRMELAAKFTDRSADPDGCRHWMRRSVLYKRGLVTQDFVRQLLTYGEVQALANEGVIVRDDTIALRLAELFPLRV